MIDLTPTAQATSTGTSILSILLYPITYLLGVFSGKSVAGTKVDKAVDVALTDAVTLAPTASAIASATGNPQVGALIQMAAAATSAITASHNRLQTVAAQPSINPQTVKFLADQHIANLTAALQVANALSATLAPKQS